MTQRGATARQTAAIWLLALFAITALRLLMAATVPLSPDEAYYLLWSQNLQPGYFDHPPMVAFWIFGGTWLLGPTALGVRLLGPLAAALGSVLLWRAGEDLFPNRHAGLFAAAFFNATLMLGAGAILMTPDTPLLFFWTAATAALARLLATRDPRWWLAVGVAAGCALLSKYTAALLVAGIFAWLITRAEGRRALRGPWPWAGFLTAAAIFAPNLAWNAGNGWVTILKQGGRVTGFDPARAAQFLAELIFGQIGLFTPIIFALAACGLWRLLRMRGPVAELLIWLTLLPAAIFLEHTLTDRVQSNWPAVIYPAACLAAAALEEKTLNRWARPALGLGLAITLLTYAQALDAPFLIPAPMDPTALQLSGWQDFATQAAAIAAVKTPAFITSDEYATAAELALYADPGAGVPVAAFGPRWSYLGLPQADALAGATGLLLTRRTDTPCPIQLGAIQRRRGAQLIDTYKICRFTAPAAMFVLPNP
jgi:4-amino-4-deoxy-L-arabinose transferase-like glycosyltransferase